MPRLPRDRLPHYRRFPDYRATNKVVSPNRLPAPTAGARFMAGFGTALLIYIGLRCARGETIGRVLTKRATERKALSRGYGAQSYPALKSC